MDKDKLKIMMHKAQKGPISELNGCITCKLCNGYFIDATTIIECLHTFCRSCIVRYLESNKYCPICDVQVHKTKPLLSIRRDKTIQDLVYKLVPRLYQNEAKRRKLFYESNPAAKASISEEYMASQYEYILAPDEAINLTLNYSGCSSTPRYLRCPSAVLISHLKKLIQAKYELSDHHKVDIFYNEEILNPSLSLMDVAYIYSWKRKEPLDLSYKIYENRAKKPKLECTENGEGNTNRSANNNNWKEVQLRISENGEMSITGIQDAGMLDLLETTENFKSEIVINEGKNMENYPKPVQVDTQIGNNEVRIQATHAVDTHSKATEDSAKENSAATPNNNSHSPESHLPTSKKELPELKLISKNPSGSSSTSTNTKSMANTKLLNSGIKMVINNAKSGANVTKITSACSEPKKSTTSSVCTIREEPTTSTTMAKLSVAESKTPKVSFGNAMPKSMELSETLNLNSELSVIPLNVSSSCISLSSCGGTTTVFSTINKSMCSTKSYENYSRGTELNDGNDNKTIINIDISKESNTLKRKCDESDKSVEVPAKLPKPTILNHSIGLINLSNNHPLKKHSKMNRNGERRNPEMSEKMPISSANLTVSHALMTQKPNLLDKPLIINKNLNYLHLGRSPKLTTAQKSSSLANVPCYMPKISVNSTGGKASEKNGEKVEVSHEKAEGYTSMPKPSVSHPHVHTYQNTHHTPVITPAQLPHHQNLNSLQLKQNVPKDLVVDQDNIKTPPTTVTQDSKSNTGGVQANTQSTSAAGPVKTTQKSSDGNAESLLQVQSTPSVPRSTAQIVDAITTVARSSPIPAATVSNCSSPTTIKAKPSTPIGYKTLRDPPKSWNSQINSQIARVNQTVKAQQLANAAAAASQGCGANAQGRYGGDLKSVRPAKFFKGRNMPRYLGNPASGVKPMYQVHVSPEKEKNQDQHTPNVKSEKSEIKKHSIVKIDPKTLKPISEKAPETSNLSNITSSLVTQNNQELRINPSTGDLKINTSSVSIFNPLKLQQNSPKNERKSPKSPHSPKVKPNSSPNTAATTTTMSSNTPSPMTALSPKQQRDKNSLTFTPSNPFVPNLASPTLNPNQFLYPAGGFPSYDPRFMAACHSLWYTQRMAAAAAAGLVPPPLPHAFGLNMGLNSATTIGQQSHSPGVAPKHSTSAKGTGQPSPRSSNTANTLTSKSSPSPINKKIKESSTVKNEKSLETALEKLTQSKVKELGGNKHLSNNDNKGLANSKDVRNGSPLHVVQKATAANASLNDNCYVDTQHKKPVAKGAGFNMTALEKLSQNKAIEILGAMSGKGSSTVQEKDGRNSSMTTGANKSVSSGNRLADSASGGRPLLPLTEQSTNSTGITKPPSPPINKKDGQKPESNKIVEPSGTVRVDKEQKVPDMKTTSSSGDEKSEKNSCTTPTEIQRRLGQPEATPEGQLKGSDSVQASCTDDNGATPRDKSDIKAESERKQFTTESSRVQCNDNTSAQIASDINAENSHPEKKVIDACGTTDDAVNETAFSGGASEKINATKASVEKVPSARSGETSSSVAEQPVLAESSEDSGGGEKTSSV